MLLSKTVDRLRREASDRGQEDRVDWYNERPRVIVGCCKSERMVHPRIGVIRNVNLYSQTLDSFCGAIARNSRPRSNLATVPSRGEPLFDPPPSASDQPVFQHSTDLTRRLGALCSLMHRHDDEALTEFTAVVTGERAARQHPVQVELRNFIQLLSSFLNRRYSLKTDSLEPFQKQLILHTLYFLITIKTPESANKLYSEFCQHFGLFGINDKSLRVYRQKAAVFLIPRRHGKTWIVTAILSILLATVSDVQLGYVAHQKHVATFVFNEIAATIVKWFGSRNIEVKRENGLIIFKQEERKKSTLMCATCFNKNVSNLHFSIRDDG